MKHLILVAQLFLGFTVPKYDTNSFCLPDTTKQCIDITSIEIYGQKTGQCDWWGMCLYCHMTGGWCWFIYWPLCVDAISPKLLATIPVNITDLGKHKTIAVPDIYNKYWVVSIDDNNNISCISNYYIK